jgi:predicted phosphodiesterase
MSMRLAVISDMHGNCIGLNAVLADVSENPVDQIVCLGDAIQGGPQPAEVVAALRELACPVVMGNADAWLLTGEETGAEQIASERKRKMGEIRQWSLSQLSEADRAFIQQFQPTVEIQLGSSKRLLCCHGSPTSFDDIILPTTPDDEVKRHFEPYPGWWLCGGHTHLQQFRRFGNTYFFNPGSAGFSYTHQQEEGNFRADPWAEYAILTVKDTTISLEFRKAPFDVPHLIAIYKDSGRPFADDAMQQYQNV